MWPFPRCRGEKSVLQLFDVVDPAEYFLMLHSVLTLYGKGYKLGTNIGFLKPKAADLRINR